MNAEVHVRVISADEWRLFRNLRQEALREAPHAFGSTLADWQGSGDTEQRWRRRLTEVPFNAIAYLDGTPVGIVSGTEPNVNGEVELISMWVDPSARGKGIGESAIRLYERCGFSDRGRIGSDPPERKMVRAIAAKAGVRHSHR